MSFALVAQARALCLEAPAHTIVKRGDRFPNAVLTRYNKDKVSESFSTACELRGRRAVVFTVPGACTPTYAKSHLAAFNDKVEFISNYGLSALICLAPGNVDAAYAWKGITMWIDNNHEVTCKLGVGLQRSAMVVTDGVVEWLQRETEADAKSVFSYLESLPVNDQVVHLIRSILTDDPDFERAFHRNEALRVLAPHTSELDLRSLNLSSERLRFVHYHFPKAKITT